MTKKGIVNMPTGGGKTLSMALAILEHARQNIGHTLHIVASPRIALANQTAREIYQCRHEFIGWGHYCYHSGEDTSLDLLIGEDRNRIKAGFNISGIKSELVFRDVICYTTYHSLPRLIIECQENGIKVGLLNCDEAHNLVSPEWNQYCDPNNPVSVVPNKILFWTATNKVTTSGQRGMNDPEYFGLPLYQIDPRRLIDEGIILRPRILLIRCHAEDIAIGTDGHFSDVDAQKIVEDTLAQYEWHAGQTARKIIVQCQSADQVGYLARITSSALDAQGYKRYGVLSDVEKRSKFNLRAAHVELDEFRRCHDHGIAFHFNMLGEGIDIPGVSAVMMLRPVDDITKLQHIGRSNRPAIGKEFADVLVPELRHDVGNHQFLHDFSKIAHALQLYGYNYSIAELVTIVDPRNTDVEFSPDTLTVPEASPSRGLIEEIELIVGDLDAIYDTGFSIPKLHIKKHLEADHRTMINRGQILLGLQEVAAWSQSEFEQLFQDQMGGIYNIQQFYEALEPTQATQNVDILKNSAQIIERSLSNQGSALQAIFAFRKEMFPSGGDVGAPPTPKNIIEQQLDILPTTTWIDPDKTFLDPACGSGAYLACIRERLMVGLKDVIPNEMKRREHILTRQIYGNDIDRFQLFLATAVLGGGVKCDMNLSAHDTPTWESDMKFDVIVGNPPYTKGLSFPDDGISELIYEAFVVKCVDHLIADNGQVVLVFPRNWMQLATHQSFRHWLSCHRVEQIINVDPMEWGNDTNVNAAIVAFGFGAVGTTKLLGHFVDGVVDLQLSEDIIPTYYNGLAKSIFEKVDKFPHKMPVTTDAINITKYSVKTVNIMGDGSSTRAQKNHTAIMKSLRAYNEEGKFIIPLQSQYEYDVYQQWWYEPLPSFFVSMLRSDTNVTKLNIGRLPDIIKILAGHPYDRQLTYDILGITQEEVDYLEAKIFILAGIDGVKNLERAKQVAAKKAHTEIVRAS